MTNQTHLTELMMMPSSEIQRYLAAVQDLVAFRLKHFQNTPSQLVEESLEKALPQVNPAQPSLLQRKPMRPPAPGSLRATVHEVLESAGKPLRRAEVIEEVARIRSVPIDTLLKAKVSDALSNRHDGVIQKVAPGVYKSARPTSPLCL
jgi:hypothetical protein